MFDAKPIGNAYDGSQIAWVLDVVESKAKFLCGNVCRKCGLGKFEDSQYLLGRFQETGFTQFLVRDLYCFCGFYLWVLIKPCSSGCKESARKER